jgi:hypothetical protein
MVERTGGVLSILSAVSYVAFRPRGVDPDAPGPIDSLGYADGPAPDVRAEDSE